MKCFKQHFGTLCDDDENGIWFEATDDDLNTDLQKKWKFHVSTRKGSHSHPKPVISAGWLPYVRAKRLREGDRIILHVQKVIKGGEARFTIQAQRKVANFKLFGTELWNNIIVEDLKPDIASSSIILS
ncbi:hypothetical protein CCACVL1_16902 [Corchorus capsularis]|uniref:TF-B3 domain-containing protein n=1 Tax=Corchorus capsularis TaxID=210143 RepID=A0A1R3HVC8_COCAP|nr:hypothetical protein CCACVL1_16902 [Corchorus capsularis]